MAVVTAQMRASNPVGRVFESLHQQQARLLLAALIGCSRGGPGAVGPISRRCCSSRPTVSAGPHRRPRRPPPSPAVPPPDWMPVLSPTGKTRLALLESRPLRAQNIFLAPVHHWPAAGLRSPTTHPSSGACHGLPSPTCSRLLCRLQSCWVRESQHKISRFSFQAVSFLSFSSKHLNPKELFIVASVFFC